MTGKRHLFRCLRNLLVLCLLLALIWAAKGYPLPMEADLHRLDRQKMVEPSTVMWQWKKQWRTDRTMLVGLSGDYVHTYVAGGGKHTLWPRQEGGTLVALPERTRYRPVDNASIYLAPAFIVADPPAAAASARLTVTFQINDWIEDYVIDGEKQDGTFFFQLRHHYLSGRRPEDSSEAAQWDEREEAEDIAFSLSFPGSPNDLSFPSYTLEFFDHTGASISKTSHTKDAWTTS